MGFKRHLQQSTVKSATAEGASSGMAHVHKGAFKASKMKIGAGSSSTARDNQRYHMNVLWKSSRGKGEGREGTKAQVTGPWSAPKPGCPGGG